MLDEFVGRPLDSASLRAIESLVREALAGDHRIVEVARASARQRAGSTGTVDLELDVMTDDGLILRARFPIGMER
jgi:hypothetical protein